VSQSAAIGPGPTTLSGVLRIALFEDDEIDLRASAIAWPGDRVETKALLMPGSAPAAPPPAAIEMPFVRPRASEPLVTASAALAALLAIVVLTAGSAAVTSMVALVLFV
jgi:hypothetical protein